MGDSHEKVYQVSELIDYINATLSEPIVVEGEISRIDRRQGGLLFITIQDKTSCLDIFGLEFRIRNSHELAEGMLVRVFGTPGLYKKSGRFRIDAEYIIPSGEGALRLAFEKLKLQLDREGLFDLERKRPLPRFPERLALVTAPGSQAYRDFIKVLRERFGGMRIDFYPVKVQGLGSEKTVVQALDRISRQKAMYDAIALVRGGGSLEDLHAFNSEEVARAIFRSRVPVVCGVGHEGDISLADLVADLRASTPSNAAELLVPERSTIFQEIQSSLRIMDHAFVQKLLLYRQRIDQDTTSLYRVLQGYSLKLARTIAFFSHRLQQEQTRIDRVAENIQDSVRGLTRSFEEHIRETSHKAQSFERLLRSLDPIRLLKRGYSIVEYNGKIITSTEQVKVGEEVSVRLSKGRLITRINQREAL